MLKQTMCMLPDSSNVKDVLLSLPPDVQALVLLYNNGADKNITSEFFFGLGRAAVCGRSISK